MMPFRGCGVVCHHSHSHCAHTAALHPDKTALLGHLRQLNHLSMCGQSYIRLLEHSQESQSVSCSVCWKVFTVSAITVYITTTFSYFFEENALTFLILAF